MSTIGRTTNVNGTQVYQGAEPAFKEGLSKMDQIKADRQEIKNDPNLSPAQKDFMLGQLDKSEAMVARALDILTNSSKYDVNTGGVGDGDINAATLMLQNADQALSQVEGMRLNVQSQPVSAPAAPQGTQGTQGTSGTQGTGGTQGTSSTPATVGPDGKPLSEEEIKANESWAKASDMMKDVDRLINLQSSDPSALMAELKGLSPEDRGMVMQQIQQRMQEINQMISMMSTLSQAAHDTMKSVIQNLRV